MPTLTRWYLKTSLVFLILALSIGLLLAARGFLSLPRVADGLGPVYFHLFMVGWVTQLIFGVVYWLFPRYGRANPRGRPWLGWATYGLLNVGLLLRVVGEPLNAIYPNGLWGWLLLLSALLQWMAGLSFVINTWPRVHGGPRRRAVES